MAKAQVVCPSCGQSYSIDEGRLGKQARCRACGSRFELVARQAPPPPPPPPRPGGAPDGVAKAERQRRLEQRLARDPKTCPNCGSRSLRSIKSKQLYSVAGDRKCTRCFCVWSPGWSRVAGVVALAGSAPLGLAFVLVGILWLVGSLRAGTWALLALLGVPGAFLIGVGLLGMSWFALRVLAGSRGRPKLRALGSANRYRP